MTTFLTAVCCIELHFSRSYHSHYKLIKPTQFKFGLRFPVFVVLLLSSFWLNAEHDVRLNLCCTVLLYHLLLMYDIAHITNGDNTPLLGTYNETILMLLFREGPNLLYRIFGL